jgi:hypothetical protein
MFEILNSRFNLKTKIENKIGKEEKKKKRKKEHTYRLG